MYKFLHPVLTVFLSVLFLNADSQKPVLVMQSFDYIWQKDFGAMSANTLPRIIIAEQDSAKDIIKNSFIKSIQQHWNVELAEVSLSVKQLPLLSNEPKFKTRLKNKEPGKWYMFLQVYDEGNPFAYNDSLSTTLKLKCIILNGANDSIIFDRALLVSMYKAPLSTGEILLTRLPAYPAVFIQAFDSIAAWLFQTEAVSEKSILLKPACVFTETTLPGVPVANLSFINDAQYIHQLTAPEFLLHATGTNIERTDAKRNKGGNTAVGAITLLTGIRSDRSRSFQYSKDFSYEDGDSAYHCFVNYIEKETAEQHRETDEYKNRSVKSESFRLHWRYTDSTFINAITVNKDTLATFSITYAADANNRRFYNQLWDGSDTTTITPLPAAWNNGSEENNFIVSGKIEGDSFLIKAVKETTVKEVYINNQLMLIMYGMQAPAKALVFQPVSTRKLKVFTILCALPYPYFNYTAN
jgi:hypothetical protein